MRVYRDLTCLLTVLLISLNHATAQEEKPEEKLPDTPAIKAFQETNAKIEKANKALTAIITKARTLTQNDAKEIEKLQQDYTTNLKELEAGLDELRKTGVAALKDAPTSKTVGDAVLQLALRDVGTDRFQSGYDLLKSLIASKNPADGIHDAATMAAFGLDDFEAAKKHLEMANANKETQRMSGRFTVESLDKHIADWKVESAIRSAEAKKNDLPRVQLDTSEGKIVIELFENEAPQAVGNFVSLVEKKYYDGLIFHRVLGGFMAQGGCPNGRGNGGPGYNIYCECHQDNYRKHFAGTLSMAHAGRDTGGSQFFLTFLPTPHLDGRHTAFGRVVEGMDVLPKLRRIDPRRPTGAEPSKIIKATVIRKRDHEYKPTKVE